MSCPTQCNKTCGCDCDFFCDLHSSNILAKTLAQKKLLTRVRCMLNDDSLYKQLIDHICDRGSSRDDLIRLIGSRITNHPDYGLINPYGSELLYNNISEECPVSRILSELELLEKNKYLCGCSMAPPSPTPSPTPTPSKPQSCNPITLDKLSGTFDIYDLVETVRPPCPVKITGQTDDSLGATGCLETGIKYHYVGDTGTLPSGYQPLGIKRNTLKNLYVQPCHQVSIYPSDMHQGTPKVYKNENPKIKRHFTFTGNSSGILVESIANCGTKCQCTSI